MYVWVYFPAEELQKQKFKPNHGLAQEFNRYVYSLPIYYIMVSSLCICHCVCVRACVSVRVCVCVCVWEPFTSRRTRRASCRVPETALLQVAPFGDT